MDHSLRNTPPDRGICQQGVLPRMRSTLESTGLGESRHPTGELDALVGFVLRAATRQGRGGPAGEVAS
jgi:hypothetical protein